MNGWGWTMMIVWSVIWIGFLAVVAWVAVEWARRSDESRQASVQPAPKSARELLDERLATGDIDPDEYERRRELLERHS